jgi:hypothetical protein
VGDQYMLATQVRAERKGTYSLGVDLADICNSLGQSITRHLVSKFISEFSCFTNSSLYRSPGICDRPSHNTADRGRQLENVRDRRWINELVLEIEMY